MPRNETLPIVVLGAGPAGMACGLALNKAGHKVIILERYPEAKPSGNILNLWPPPIKALEAMGVDINDLGAPCHTTFRNSSGKIRADIQIPSDVINRYGGGFIGMLRPDLYKRMLAHIPKGMIRANAEVVEISDLGDFVRVTLKDGSTLDAALLVGADGIDSFVRRTLWGDSQKREHNLHIIGGYTFDLPVEAERGVCIISHGRRVQGSYSSIRSDGKNGHQWWVLEATDPNSEGPVDLKAHATKLASGFSAGLRKLVELTPAESLQRWIIRDRVPLKQWSKGRITLAGDAAHATSPYAAYGAGMGIGDGYFLGQLLAKVNLSDKEALDAALMRYDEIRIPHTSFQVNLAYRLGQLFHHTAKPIEPIRDFVMDHTPFLQKVIGEKSPAEIIEQLSEMGEGIK